MKSTNQKRGRSTGSYIAGPVARAKCLAAAVQHEGGFRERILSEVATSEKIEVRQRLKSERRL